MSAVDAVEEPAHLSRIQEKNRALILDAALSEFSKYGFQGATIEKISKAAGMSKSNLLYYFSSKPAVYQAVLAHILDEWLTPLRTLDANGDPAEELSKYIMQKMKVSAEAPEASRLFANEIMQGAPRVMSVLEHELKPLFDEKSQVIQDWIDSGKIEPVDPAHLIFTIWAMTQHYADFESQISALTGSTLGKKAFRSDATSTIIRMVLRGIGLEPAKPNPG
ncbi:TetR family transcriptional regulator [Roseibium hamelinense]|uniref:TetR family transcriptional regulator n=1 Tax=Roseibium hamelinense TaxID=150831 RepID=A0A562TH72_9HYPH|nr:TetR family transcriptional regulator C-terminal domain-containing protein [Roseibium hamelinense]MTI45847.1 TetR family transcriptional regulator [Roseibium hamelinense]TWI92971.1 TetR family transcriptional regulator [Roseibium hamelinense]